MTLLINHFIPKKSSKVKLTKPTYIQIFKRFYPSTDKLITKIGSNPSKNLLEMLKTLEGKKQFANAYLDFLSKIHVLNKNYSNINTIIFQDKKYLDDYCVVSKQISKDIIINNAYREINKFSIKTQMEPLNLQDSKPILKNLVSFLVDSKIPASNWTKLLILERVDSKIIATGFTRAFIFDSYLNEQVFITGDSDILNKFIIHIGHGKAGVDFMSELFIGHQHQKIIDKMSSVKVSEYHMLYKIKPGSDNYNHSMKHTGQANCDIRLVLQHTHDKHKFSLYMDIKQNELDFSHDSKYLFVKVDYSVDGKKFVGIIDNPDHAKTYVKMCLQKLEELRYLKEVNIFMLKINKLEATRDKLFVLHEFILSKVEQHPQLQMAIMFQTIIEPENSIYTPIAEKNASKVPDDVLTNQKSFEAFSNKMYQKFIEQHSGNVEEQSRIESIKKHLLNNKIFKPSFMETKDHIDIN